MDNNMNYSMHNPMEYPIAFWAHSIYFIYTGIFASNFAVWKSVSDFTSTNKRGETSCSHMKKIGFV